MPIIPPSQNPTLIGHDAALRQVADAYASGRMHHAWMISGIEGIGKTTLAFHIAHFVLSGGTNSLGNLNMQHPAARLVAGEAHPDLFILRRPVDDKTGELKDTIPVEAAREIAPFLHKTATHGGWRMAIIDEAHALNRNGQNAILKIIEEPPQKCLIVITAATPGVLLPTIRSRCRMLPLQPLEDSTLRALMARYGADNLPDADLKRVVRLASGSIGMALKIAETESLPIYDELLTMLQNLPKLDMAKLHKLADGMSRKADVESFRVITALLVDLLRRAVKSQATGVFATMDAAEEKALASLTNSASVGQTLQLFEKTAQIFAETDHANLDKKLAFINAITGIRRA